MGRGLFQRRDVCLALGLRFFSSSEAFISTFVNPVIVCPENVYYQRVNNVRV